MLGLWQAFAGGEWCMIQPYPRDFSQVHLPAFYVFVILTFPKVLASPDLHSLQLSSDVLSTLDTGSLSFEGQLVPN